MFNCRECKGIIYKDAPMVCRDGRKLRFHYHEKCFSGEADPRTQAGRALHSLPFSSLTLSRLSPEPTESYPTTSELKKMLSS